MSQKKNKHEPPFLHGNGGKKTVGKNFSEDTKLRANVISKLCNNFQDSFDLSLIASVAHTCQWDITRATEALTLLSGGKKNMKKNKNSKGPENKAKSLPGTLKQVKAKNGKRIGSGSPVHYNSTNSLSSSQVWQRHYKSKPQSPGLLTMIPPQNKEPPKPKKPPVQTMVPKAKPTREITLKQKMISEVKRIMQLINNGVKVMIIMRGAPGSGKTHFAQCIVGLVTGNEMSQHILSTDDYFIMLGRGNYAYEYNQLPQAHNWNQKRVSEALKRGINPIIVDNTNIQAWEMQPYVYMAVEHEYVIEVLEPVTEWKYKEAELAKRNIHSVPREKIRQMLERYEPGWTGEKLLKSFGLKYKNSGSTVVTQEKRLPTNSLLAQHRQNAVVDAPEKPKRKKNASKKKDRHNMAGIEITEDKEKQLEELKNLFAEYGKKMNPSTKQKVLESGVSIAEVVSRMRKLQGNVLPLPSQSIPSTIPEADHQKPVFYDNKAIHPVPTYPSPRKDFFTEALETDTMSSSNASETSECETDTDIDLPKWKEMRRYFETGGISGDFVDGEDLFEDDDDEDNENERRQAKDEGAVGGIASRCHISSSQEELSLIDFGTRSLPNSYSPDNLSLLNYAEMESQNRDSSSSSEEQETQMLSLQESLREVLIENRSSDDSNRKKGLEKENGVVPPENIIEQSTIEITDSLREAMGRRYEKPERRPEDSEEMRGGVSINESLLQMLVKKYSSDETALEKTEKDNSSEIPTKDLSFYKRSPDLEEVPLPSIPPEPKTSDTSAAFPKTANFPFDWCGTKTDKFEDIVNSWEHPRVVESKPDDSPKQARPKNALLGAIKKNVAQPREKSPEELLRSADLGWSSISFDSWEDVRKKPTGSGPESANYPKLQRKPVTKIDSFTNTSHSDFNLWKEEGEGTTLKLNARSRNINPNYKESKIPIGFKSDILMLDKSSMTVDAEELEPMSKDSGLETLSGMFPDISKEYLNDVFEKCKGNILWAIEVLLETPQNLAKIPERPLSEGKPPSYNEAKAMGDSELASLQNVVIADGKKTIKRKKDKKSSASELSLLLKKQIEESIQINEDLYEDKTLFLKKLRHGEIEFGDEPILPVPTIPEKDGGRPEKFEKEEEEEDEDEEMIPMKIDPEFFNIFTRQFGVPDSSSNEKQIALAPVINIPMSLAQQIYDCWLDTVNKQLEEMQCTYDQMVKEDELLATALQEQEFEYRQPDLREIMDMELAMLLYKQDQALLHENQETLATKLSKQLLFEAYPNMDKKMLLDLFESEGRSFKKVVDVLEAQENKTPITVVAPEFLTAHGNKLMEQAKSENLYKEKKEPGAKKTIIVLKESPKKKKEPDEKNVLVVNPAEYRQKIAHLQQQRNDCCRLAQEAFRKKSFSVASYFSHMASLYKERIQDLEKDQFQSSMFEEKRKRDSTRIDLHFTTVREALQIVDLFLDHHIKRLRERNESTVSLDMITGRGKHSDRGISKLRPAVETRLKKRELSYHEVNRGMLNVTVHKKDLLSEEM